MTKDEIVKTETEIHEAVRIISAAWFDLGIIEGHESVVHQLRTQAGELYAAGGCDDQAKLCRAVAEGLEVECQVKRREYNAGAMKAKETAYADLQRLVNILACSAW